MSDYYEVQAAESRPGAVSLSSRVVCLKPSKRLRQARVRRLSPLSLPPRRLSLAKSPPPHPRRSDRLRKGGRVREKTTDRANNADPARQVQRTVACVGRGLDERESSLQVLGAGDGLFVFPWFVKYHRNSAALRKGNVTSGIDPNC